MTDAALSGFGVVRTPGLTPAANNTLVANISGSTAYPTNVAISSIPFEAADITVGTTTITSGTTTRVLYDNGGILGEYTISGTGSVVMTTSPTLVTPTLGVAAVTSINRMVITAPATSSTLAVADGKTLTASNTITFTATDGSTLAIGAGGTLASAAYVATGTSGATIPLLNGVNTWASSQTFSAAITYGGVTLSNSVTGTGSMALSSSPSFTTPDIGVASGTSFTSTSGDVSASNIRASGGADNTLEVKTTGGVGGDWLLQVLSASGNLRIYDLSGGGAGEVITITKGTGAISLNKATTMPVDRGFLFTNQTSSAGAQTGTITNAPAAGNPGFWLKIVIGGVNYSIPCWAG